MKKAVFLFILFLQTGLLSVSAQFETKLTDELYISKISDKVFIVTHYFPWESNSLIVKASDIEVVLVDTPYNSSATSKILEWINKHFSPEKITAINTGFHIDNLGGNGCLSKKGINIYGSNLTVQLIDEQGAKTQKQILSWLSSPEQDKYRSVYETMSFEKPNRIFPINEGLLLKTGNLSFEVYFPGESHAPDNVTVYIKELDILFGGCMIKSLSSNNLGFTGDANLTEWPKSVKKLQKKYSSAKLVIPHHGMWGDLSLLQHTIDLFNK